MSGADLVTHLATFAGALRHRGVAVSLQDEADALAALALVDLGDRAEVRLALLVAFKIRASDRETFAELFDRLWREAPPLATSKRDREAAGAVMRRSAPAARRALAAEPEDDSSGPPRPDAGERRQERPGYSPEATLRRKPFEQCTPGELVAMERLLARLALQLATRPSRRREPSRGRGEPDLRRSFRRAVGSGGEMVALSLRRRAVERTRLVALVDTSGSMDPHARFLLAFLLALRGVAPGSELFAFNTTLVRLTRWLRPGRAGAAASGADPVATALARVAAAVPEWSGGTKIGECLATFVERHLEALVDARTVVLILSDGLDRGDVEPLRGAMRALRGRARRVLWLNPLAGDPRYEPSARAMAAALPYVDRLLPAHDLASLERLLPLLAA